VKLRPLRYAAACASALSFAPLAPAQAQNLGGGFLEYLATGGQSPAPGRQQRAAAYYGQSAGYGAGVVMNRPPANAMQASLAPVQPRREIPRDYLRREVDYPASGKIGSIVIDTPNHYLYLITAPGHAMRYGIGVGRPGFTWSGHKTISRKAEWPGWTPPPEMMKRRPDLPRHMDGGPDNPLGARALYLGSSMYRIHGTNEPWTIGQNVSSGCIRMMNEDVIDLYQRVPVGAPVTIL
jgi:lipoprotein-anchoring transpeptidase ErfK/SrfK